MPEKKNSQKTRKPWEAAEILEEIAKNADPIVIFRKSRDALLGDAERSKNGYAFHVDPGSVRIEYHYPIGMFADVEGSPQEILEWVNTGLGPNQSAELGTREEHQFIVIRQIHREQWLIDEIKKISQDFSERFRQRSVASE
jgi:hypothetical protein